MVASSYKVNGILDQELEEELMKFTTKYEENKVEAYLVEQTEKIYRNADMEVDITERTKYGADEMVEVECLDTTESSSSFDGSDYGFGNFDALDETEVLSDSRDDIALVMDFDGFDEIFGMRIN